MFFQVPFVPELMFQINDLEFVDMLLNSLPNQKPSKEDIEAYKYTFSKSGL